MIVLASEDTGINQVTLIAETTPLELGAREYKYYARGVGIVQDGALKLVKKLHLSLNIRLPSVRLVLRNFAPVVIARGVVQISTYIDNVLANILDIQSIAT